MTHVVRRKRSENPTLATAKSVFLGATIAHGYKPARGALFLVVLVLTGVALLSGHPARRSIVATKAAISQPGAPNPAVSRPTALSCPGDYPCFNPWIYSAETVIPLIKLGQTDNWTPAGGANRYRLWVWAATAFGWLFTTLAVAGLTGVIRKD